MNLDNKRTHWVSVAAFIITGYLVIFCEARFHSLRQLICAQIDLVPGMFVYAAVSFNAGIVIGSAALLGLMFDSISANPLGTTSLALVLTSFGLFYFRELILPDQLTAQFVLGIAASAAVPFIAVLAVYGSGGQPLVHWGSLIQWLLVSAGGGAFTPLWFLVFNRLDKALRYKEVAENSFRPDREIARGRSF